MVLASEEKNMDTVIDGIYDAKNPLSSVATYTASQKGTVKVYVSYALHGTRNDDGDPAKTVGEQIVDALPGSSVPEEVRHSEAQISCTINESKEWVEDDYEFSDLHWKWEKIISVEPGERVSARVERSNKWADPVPGGEDNRDKHGLAFRLIFTPFIVTIPGKVKMKL